MRKRTLWATSLAPEIRDMGDFYDRYAAHWDGYYRGMDPRGEAYRERQRCLLELVESTAPPGTMVLELGSGAGHAAATLAERGYHMTCVDISGEMLARARATFARAELTATFIQATIEELPGKEDQDLVIASGVLEHIESWTSSLQAIHDRLRPGGACILSFLNAATPLYWLETPPKRALATAAYFANGGTRWEDVAGRRTRATSEREVRALFRKANLEVTATRYWCFGVRFGRFWWPPLRLLKRMEKALQHSFLARLGREFLVVARKPSATR